VVICRNCFNDEDFKASSVLCGGSNEPSVLTAGAVGLTTSSVAQLDRSVGNKVTLEDVSPHPEDTFISKPSISMDG
jgi:hypothetical protein